MNFARKSRYRSSQTVKGGQSKVGTARRETCCGIGETMVGFKRYGNLAKWWSLGVEESSEIVRSEDARSTTLVLFGREELRTEAKDEQVSGNFLKWKLLTPSKSSFCILSAMIHLISSQLSHFQSFKNFLPCSNSAFFQAFETSRPPTKGRTIRTNSRTLAGFFPPPIKARERKVWFFGRG